MEVGQTVTIRDDSVGPWKATITQIDDSNYRPDYIRVIGIDGFFAGTHIRVTPEDIIE